MASHPTLLLCLFCASIAHSEASVDLNKLLADDGALTEYINCFLEKGPCNPEYEELKNTASKNIKDGCASCSDEVKKIYYEVGRKLIETRPDDFKAVAAKVDPSGQYIAGFKDRMNAYLG